MGLLRDWNYIEKATEIPALSEMIRDALIRALFVRDDRILPARLVADLSHLPPVTVKVKDDGEVRKLVRVLNGQESTVSLGLSAEDYHYFRTELGVGRTREFGLVVRPRTLLTYDWIVPEHRGVQLDFASYADVEFAETGHRVIAQVGASWKRIYDEALSKGHYAPFVPTVPLDFAIGDALFGDAPFASYRGELGTYVNGLRTISPFGHRARLGFEEVANNGTAYDLLHTILPLVSEFCVPVAVALRLEPKPPSRKTLTYGFDDRGKLAVALDKLARTPAGVSWVHITDAIAAKILRPSATVDAFAVQVSLGGTTTSMPGKEKVLDAAMTGFKTKNADLPSPFDVPADTFRKTAEAAARSLFVGEVRVPAKTLGDVISKIQALGEQSVAKAGFYGSLRESGTVSLFPCFAAPKDRTKQHDLSKGVRTIVSKQPGAVFASRLAHLWEEEPGYMQRMGLIRSLKLTIDTAHVMQPLVAP